MAPWLVFLSPLMSCGLEAGGFSPGGVGERDLLFAVAAPASPAAPEFPVMTPCPSGWHEEGAGPVFCEPWPKGLMEACGGAAAHFVGDVGCATVGTPCPVDGWPTGLPQGRTVLYVKASALGGGNGTQAKPFSTVAEALDQGGGGKVLALAPGQYALSGVLPQGTALVGACVAQTSLTVSSVSQPAIVYSQSAGVEVRNLRVSGPGVGLAVNGAGAHLHVEDVVVDGAVGIGWLVQNGAQATGRNVVVRNTQARSDGTLGHGLHVTDGSVVEAVRLVVDHNRVTGVFLYGAGATVKLTDAVVTSTQRTTESDGRGIWANQGARVELKRSVIEKSWRSGVEALASSTVELTDVVVRGTQSNTTARGDGIWVGLGSTLTGTRILTEYNAGLGVGATDQGTRATLTHCVARSDSGLGASDGALLAVSRAWLHASRVNAVIARMANTLVTASDLTVTDTQVIPGRSSATGLLVMRGAAVELSRARFQRCNGMGAMVTSPGSRRRATDISVTDIAAGVDGNTGFGIVITEGTDVKLERTLIRAVSISGIYAMGPSSTLELTDVEVSHTRTPIEQKGLFGNAMTANSGAHVTGTRVRFAENKDVSLITENPGTVVNMREVVVVGTTLDCDGNLNPDCMGRPSVGVTALDRSEITLSRFQVASNAELGIQLAEGAQLDLSDGEVSYHTLAVSLLNPGYDVGRLDQRVQYRNNEQKLSATVVPLPKVAKPPPLPQ